MHKKASMCTGYGHDWRRKKEQSPRHNLYSPSSMAAKYKEALSGRMTPPGLSHLSLAKRTVSNMLSYSSKYLQAKESCSDFQDNKVQAW